MIPPTKWPFNCKLVQNVVISTTRPIIGVTTETYYQSTINIPLVGETTHAKVVDISHTNSLLKSQFLVVKSPFLVQLGGPTVGRHFAVSATFLTASIGISRS